MTGPSAVLVERVVSLVRSRPARLGSTRLLAVDGLAGSGKSTLAQAVATATGAPVVRMDDLYPGWDGLFSVEDDVRALLAPLAGDGPGSYRRYDWEAGAFAEEHTVLPAPLLVLEGVGAGRSLWAPWLSVTVWVEADDEVRLERGLARDGEQFREQWSAWMADEARLFAVDDVRSRADLVVST